MVQTDNNVKSSNYTFDSLINNVSSPSGHYIRAVASRGEETYQKEWYCSVQKVTILSGQTWELKNEYSLTLLSADVNSDKALLSLKKNEELVDQQIVSAGSYYCYNRTVNGIDQNIIKIYISDIFQGQINSLIVIEELQQYSDTGTLDTNPVKLLETGDTWELGNGYSVSIVGVDEEKDYCIISLDKDDTTMDKRIIDANTVYVYQRMDENTNSIKTILELPILNVFNSISKECVEFSSNYTLYSDADTVDFDPFVLIQTGEIWELDNGYAITIEEISGKKALVSIEKNEIIVDHDIIDENSIYTYNRVNFATGAITPIITISSSKIFNGNSEDYIEFSSEYQINSDTNTLTIDDRTIIEAGNSFEFNNGHSISLVSTGFNNEKAMFSLSKDEELYDEFILDTGEYYHLNRTVDGTELTIISFQLENVFSGETDNIAIISDIVQNPDIFTDDINIATTEKDSLRIRSLIYKGINLNDIIGYNETDHLEINASDFAGFYYDLDEGVSTETLTISGGSQVTENIIDSDGIMYETKRVPVEYESSNLEGYYEIFSIFGERYVPISRVSLNKTAELVIDTDDKISLKSGQTLYLPKGYEITPLMIDVDGEKVWIQFTKDGEFIEDEVIDVSDEEMWTYDEDVAGENDVVVMKIKITDIIQQNNGYGTILIEGLWLIDFENVLEIKVDDDFGEMQVSEIGAGHLEMTNPNTIELKRNSIVELTDKYSFMVADKDELEFCLIEELEDSDTCEVRGTVFENGTIFKWTPVNFEGFYHGFSGKGGTETLIATISGRDIDNADLVYQTSPALESFRNEEWGAYSTIVFLGENYLAAYTESAGFESSTVNLLSHNMLSKVLIDENTEYVLYDDSVLILENGYELEVLDIDKNNNILSLSLAKDGFVIETAEVHANSDYVYKTNIQNADDVPIVAVHFNAITNEDEVNSTYVDGIFQISDECLVLSIGNSFGQMDISSISADGISMVNGNDILLSQGSNLNITENLYFRVADDEDVRFYPFMQLNTPSIKFRTLGPADGNIETESGTCHVFEVATTKECNYTWFVDDVEIQSNDSCMTATFSYAPASPGSHTVTVQADNSDEMLEHTWSMYASIPTSSTSDTSASTASGSSSGGGGGGGGGGTTGEDYDNILKKEVVRENVNKGMEITYNFKEEVNPVEFIKFTALKNAGPISATIEVLNDKSIFADTKAPDEVYKYMNIWIGKTGFVTPANVENTHVQFKVEKRWIKENNIQESSICLYRYDNSIWNELATQKVDEDDKYIYFISETSGFSVFAITGEALELTEKTDVSYSLQDNTEYNIDTNESENSKSSEQKSTSGFGITAVITLYSLAALVLRSRN
ncbi:MAG: S-layer protein domain-containing protein [Methanolobus sp.]